MTDLDVLVQFDFVLVGGGLQNALMALAIRAHRPHARIALVERTARLGGNHTWCFHDGDVAPGDRAWVEPLVAHRWNGYEVSFPELDRGFTLEYSAVTSERLAAVVGRAMDVPGSTLLTEHAALEVGEHAVVVRGPDGERVLRGEVVVDARGPGQARPAVGGYQKFVGLELRTAEPHGLDRPILFDACVAQVDGFRFFYLLPLGPDRLLVEDTRFSDGDHLDIPALRAQCFAYATRRGWRVREVIREEHGVLPMPVALEPPLPTGGPLIAGYQGGWFHPATGYSFAVAARLASYVGRTPPAEVFGIGLEEVALQHHRQLAIAVRLNRMLFGWFAPEDRVHVLRHFYRLPADTIRRFYAMEMGPRDVARIFLGRPPRGLRWMRMFGLEGA